jgi:uncharacterized membrane protein YccC
MQRLRLLAADLVAFDQHRLGWRLATRTLLAFLLPLLAARLLDIPVLVYMALGGFLIAIGDSIDDGDRHQFPRIAVGTLAGAGAVAWGVLAGGNLFLALAGTLFCCLFAGLIGLYGNAFATMGLPIAWAYVEVGLPAHRHDSGFAMLLAALWAAGGCLAALLTYLVKTGGADATLRQHCADCYRALARYFEALRQKDRAAVVSPETTLRAAIGEARRIAANRRPMAGAPSQRMQQQTALIDIADRLFSEAALFHDQGATSPTRVEALDSLAAASLEVARAVSSKAPAPRIDALLARLIGDGTVASPGRPVSPPPSRSSAAALLVPLRDCLNWQSIIARHALRFALVTCAAVGVFWVFPPPFGYWVPLTVTVVLKPYAGVTVSRTVQRVVGTVSGVLIGTALMPLLPDVVAQITATAAAFFSLMLVLPFNYSLAIFFLSLGIVPFEHAAMPDLTLDVGLLRVVATVIGGMLGLVGGHLLWPNFERRELPALLQRCLRSAAAYAAAVGSTALPDKRRAAGLDTTNFHMSAQRALSEFALAPHDRDNIAIAAASLQQLMLAINALALEAGETDAEANKLLISLAEGRTGGRDAANALRRLRTAAPGLPLHRVGAEIETLTHCQENWS